MNRLVVAIALTLAVNPVASVFGATIIVDEYGNGLPFRIGNDPGPGNHDPKIGGANFGVLIYTLPFKGVQGDVIANNEIVDVLRFNGDFTLVFYSDGGATAFDSIADTDSGAPGDYYTNMVLVNEAGQGPFQDRNGVITYTPLPTQPGYDVSAPTYVFISDGQLPEPASILLMSGGLMLLMARFVHRKLRIRVKLK